MPVHRLRIQLLLAYARLKATQELGPTYSEEAITIEAKAIYEQMRSVYQRHKAVIEA